MRLQIEGKAVWINYHHLFCFYVILNEGGLTQAAKVLGIGASALSIQMKQFEEHLGFSLFERAHRKLQANERGKLVYSYAKEIFRLGNELIETLHDRPTAKRHHLQIGALDTIPKHLTVQLVKEALQNHHCTVTVVEGKQNELLKSLTEHKIDLVLTHSFPQTEPGKIISRQIARLPIGVFAAKSFLPLAKDFPASLDSQPFVLPTGDSHVRHDFENYCRQRRILLEHVTETQDVMVQKLLAIDGIGLTVVPELAVRDYVSRKELYPIGMLPELHEELYLVAASRKVENPIAVALMKSFKPT